MELLQVLYAPAEAFKRLRGKKLAWILPTILMIGMGLGSITILLGRFSVMSIIEHQMAQNGQEIPPQGLGAAAGFVSVLMYVTPPVMTLISVFLTALVILAIVKGFSGETSYPMLLNSTSYAMFAYSVVSTILFLLMLMTAPDLLTFNLDNPIPLNAGYFVSAKEVGKPVVALLSGFNLLNFYLIYLLALGASMVSERVKTGSVIWPLVGIYVLWTLAKAGLAAIF